MKKYICLFIFIFLIGVNNVFANDIVKFSKCVDGDTFRVIIKDEDKTIRLLAVDTPELAKNGELAEYYANEASDYTCNKVKNAKKIELEYDSKSDKTDKYGRVLAWVYVDGKLLQEDLVVNGYAKVAYLYDEYKYNDMLKEKQELASNKEIGIWNTLDKKKYEEGNEGNDDVISEDSDGLVVIVGVIILFIVFICDKIFNKK